MKSFEGG